MFAENTEDPTKFKKELEGSGADCVEMAFNFHYDISEYCR
jgi:hypothetical protein